MRDHQQEWSIWPPFAELTVANGYPGDEWFGQDHWYAIDEEDAEEEAMYVHRDAARAWAGLAMWCECVGAFTHDVVWVARDMAEEEGREDARAECRAWQHLRDWLDGTAEQWQERIEDERFACDATDALDQFLREEP